MKRVALRAASTSIWPDATAELLATKPTTQPPMRPKAVTMLRARGLELEVLAVVADLLDEERDVERRVHPGRLGERAPEEDVLLDGEAVDRIRRLHEGRQRAVVVGQVAEQADRRAQRG